MEQVIIARNLQELLENLDNDKRRIIAGCTDVMVALRNGKLQAKPVLDINEVQEIKRIFEIENKVYIGSNVSLSSIIENQLINDNFNVLVMALRTIGSCQIRNRATLGGNIQNASPSSDGVLALTLLDAKLILKSLKGERAISINDFICGVGKTQLKQDEFIEYIVIDKKYSSYSSYFEKVGLRNAMVISISSIGVLAKHKNNIIEDIKIAYGAVAPKVIRIQKAEQFLIGKKLSSENLLRVQEIIGESISPIGDIRASSSYRLEVSKNIILRLLDIN
jgi:CO/xanthine dehydrogenase FAD-binding subunit